LDEGLLTSGIIPAVRHALGSLTTHEAIVLPASATVYMQAVEVRTTDVCGLDMSAANLYRWHPSYATGPPLDQNKVKVLSEPVPVWYFDFKSPPESSDVKNIDVEFTTEGRFNAVMYWYDLHLWGDVHLSSGPEDSSENNSTEEEEFPGQRYLQPALQYIAGELRVDPGHIMPVIASHNTVGMRFDIETAEYLHLMKADASFPHRHFNMLANQGKEVSFLFNY
jgi:type III protein arginine methyltransferase